jgi:hypothetical protein
VEVLVVIAARSVSRLGVVDGVTTSEGPSMRSSTSLPSSTERSRAYARGMRMARLFPQRWTVPFMGPPRQ